MLSAPQPLGPPRKKTQPPRRRHRAPLALSRSPQGPFDSRSTDCPPRWREVLFIVVRRRRREEGQSLSLLVTRRARSKQPHAACPRPRLFHALLPGAKWCCAALCRCGLRGPIGSLAGLFLAAEGGSGEDASGVPATAARVFVIALVFRFCRRERWKRGRQMRVVLHSEPGPAGVDSRRRRGRLAPLGADSGCGRRRPRDKPPWRRWRRRRRNLCSFSGDQPRFSPLDLPSERSVASPLGRQSIRPGRFARNEDFPLLGPADDLFSPEAQGRVEPAPPKVRRRSDEERPRLPAGDASGRCEGRGRRGVSSLLGPPRFVSQRGRGRGSAGRRRGRVQKNKCRAGSDRKADRGPDAEGLFSFFSTREASDKENRDAHEAVEGCVRGAAPSAPPPKRTPSTRPAFCKIKGNNEPSISQEERATSLISFACLLFFLSRVGRAHQGGSFYPKRRLT